MSCCCNFSEALIERWNLRETRPYFIFFSKHIVTRIGIRILFQGDIKSCLTLRIAAFSVRVSSRPTVSPPVARWFELLPLFISAQTEKPFPSGRLTSRSTRSKACAKRHSPASFLEPAICVSKPSARSSSPKYEAIWPSSSTSSIFVIFFFASRNFNATLFYRAQR